MSRMQQSKQRVGVMSSSRASLNRVAAWAGLALCVVPVLAIVPGCGGGSNGLQQTNVTFLGHYTGTVALSGGRTGALALDTRTDFTTSGTFTVNTPGGPASVSNVAGSLASNGAFQVAGTITLSGVSQSIGISGGLPFTGSGPGSFVVQLGVNGPTFTGVIPAPGSTPTPAPTATPTPKP